MTVWGNPLRKLAIYAFYLRFLSQHIKKSNCPAVKNVGERL